jgi:hypothetical protein
MLKAAQITAKLLVQLSFTKKLAFSAKEFQGRVSFYVNNQIFFSQW